MEEKLTYEVSDTNFSGYLMYLGHKVVETKVTKKNTNGKLMVSFIFEGNPSEFDKIHKHYKFDEVKINLSKFSDSKDKAFRLVKDTLHNYVSTQK